MDNTKVPRLIVAFAAEVGAQAFVDICMALMAGADRNDHIDALRALTGHAWNPGDPVFNPESWPDYWVRTWGARGLLYVWDDKATEAILAGLADEYWRPAEMCLKVAARHGVAGIGDEAVLLLTHGLPRVRGQALRALAVVGDTIHMHAVAALFRDADPVVRQRAQNALQEMSARLDVDLKKFQI